MKRSSVLILLALVLLLTVAVAAPAAAQAEFTCDDGSNVVVTNGVEFDVNIRPGDYRATVIGLNGFDPVLAVVETATGGNLCNDDEPNAASYAANLPTTGVVSPSGLNAQMEFSNTGSDFLSLVLLVGGLNGTGGEFILLFEGMQVTTTDGDGDPFAINFSPNLVNSEVGIHAYVLHVEPSLDPLLAVVDGNSQVVTLDGEPVYCDDASNADLCWGDSVSLEGASLTDGTGIVVGDPFDAMISLPTTLLDANTPYDSAFINFLVSSFKNEANQQSTGEYVFAIHTGIAGAGAAGSTGNVIPQGQPGGPAVTAEPGTTTVANAEPIDCTVNARAIEGDVGTAVNVECPANCTGGLWGTGTYTDDSAICAAGVHAGVIPASGGQFSVTIAAGQDAYNGSTANGITSSDWGSWTRSFVPGPVIGGTSTSSGNNTSSGSTTSAGSEVWNIAYGDSGSTQIDSPDGDTYVFDASARDVVTIAVDSDAFDPLIIVTDINGRELSRDDDSGSGFNALISNLRIPSDGQYLLQVTSFTGAPAVGAAYDISITGG
ncbi:MAG TPA: LCCL domain-containing protein [Candidatus Limnocylindrales bacterium]|nr:LCCL domain-containing protein [Candidatus Limnocylindrales bacterium]